MKLWNDQDVMHNIVKLDHSDLITRVVQTRGHNLCFKVLTNLMQEHIDIYLYYFYLLAGYKTVEQTP